MVAFINWIHTHLLVFMKSIKFLVMLLVSAVSQPVSSAGIVNYKQDAVALCEIYNPIHWEDFFKTREPLEVYPELGIRIGQAIKTEEFRNIFQRYLDERHSNFHAFIKGEVSQLIGEEWQCAYFDNFNKPVIRKELQISVRGIKTEKSSTVGDEIVVTIDQNGAYYVNGKPLINKEESTLTQAIKISAGKTAVSRLVIRADAQSPNVAMLAVFSACNTLGIETVGIEVE